ncbi:MAG: hypothetical protein AAGG75_14205 [Bacteroidota bacterium]
MRRLLYPESGILDAFDVWGGRVAWHRHPFGAFGAGVDGGRWTVDGGRWAVDGGRWAVDGGRWAVDGGRWTVGGGRWTVDGGRWAVDGGRWTVVSERSETKETCGAASLHEPLHRAVNRRPSTKLPLAVNRPPPASKVPKALGSHSKSIAAEGPPLAC